MKRILPAFLLILFFAFAAFYFLRFKTNASAATATHLVISEVQVAGASPSADFIEIYNPTASDVSLNGLRLAKRTSMGTTSASIVAFNTTEKVSAHGYYLWCNTVLDASLNCDKDTTATVADNNSIAILNGSLTTGTVVDAVTFGTVASPLGEGTSLTAPASGTSVERKANSSSTLATMGIGGADEFMGNGEDTNDNPADFVGRASSQAQNSQATEVLVTPTPTLSPTQTPTPSLSPSPSPEPSTTPTQSPTGTPTPTPTVEPTATPTPTDTLTPTPTIEPSASPTPTQAITPTPSPTPVVTIAPTPTVSPTLSPTPTPQVIFTGNHISCTLNFKSIRFFNFNILIPVIKCMRI